MSLFGKVAKTLNFGGAPDLNGMSQQAFALEQERLRKLRIQSREDSQFLIEEGKGVSEQANVTFGDQLDLENLTAEERAQRSTGRITPGTGLIL